MNFFGKTGNHEYSFLLENGNHQYSLFGKREFMHIRSGDPQTMNISEYSSVGEHPEIISMVLGVNQTTAHLCILMARTETSLCTLPTHVFWKH